MEMFGWGRGSLCPLVYVQIKMAFGLIQATSTADILY